MDKTNREIRNQEVLRLYNLRTSYREIAKTVGLSKAGVHKIIHSITDNCVSETEAKINVRSLRDIAIYLQGIKDGKGNLLPLGNIVLEDLWEAIGVLNKQSSENYFSAKEK